MDGIPDVQELENVVTQGSIVQPTDVVVTVQVGQTDTHQTPELCQVSILKHHVMWRDLACDHMHDALYLVMLCMPSRVHNI